MQLRVENGTLLTEKGASFRVLQLPAAAWMSVEVPNKVEELIKAGAIVSGAKPNSAPGNIADSWKARNSFPL